jgi:hypothetical protein
MRAVFRWLGRLLTKGTPMRRIGTVLLAVAVVSMPYIAGVDAGPFHRRSVYIPRSSDECGQGLLAEGGTTPQCFLYVCENKKYKKLPNAFDKYQDAYLAGQIWGKGKDGKGKNHLHWKDCTSDPDNTACDKTFAIWGCGKTHAFGTDLYYCLDSAWIYQGTFSSESSAKAHATNQGYNMTTDYVACPTSTTVGFLVTTCAAPSEVNGIPCGKHAKPEGTKKDDSQHP